MATLWLLLAIQLLFTIGKSANSFAFGNTQGNYMVLQQSPYKSQVWGTAPTANAEVVIQLFEQANSELIETVKVTADSSGIWSTYFNPRIASNIEYEITATLNDDHLSLQHVVFGDVYMCSGQSNMEFTVDQAFNATAEVAAANNYPMIRVFTAAEIGSASPQTELLKIEENWSVAGSGSIGGGNWTFMSAMCWFFGKNMYNYLQYPIGLIGSDYGGTPVRYWSSPDALQECGEVYIAEEKKRGLKETKTNDDILTNNPKYYSSNNNIELADSQLWNAMIYPFLKTTIKAAIWYQGEADSNPQYAAPYACQFPAMIRDWRLKWSLYSDTAPGFPFGYVQLSTWNDAKSGVPCGDDLNCTDVAIVRWAQSGNYGYVPNQLMPNTFMASAVDLGDPSSPFGDVHPRYKQQVAERLTIAGKNIIYGDSSLYWQGPIADSATVVGSNVIINFRNVGQKGLTIKNSDGFEIYDAGSYHWFAVTGNITTNGDYDVVVPIPGLFNNINQTRYNWRQAPCLPEVGIYNCAIYDTQNQLPATPFIIKVDTQN